MLDRAERQFPNINSQCKRRTSTWPNNYLRKVEITSIRCSVWFDENSTRTNIGMEYRGRSINERVSLLCVRNFN